MSVLWIKLWRDLRLARGQVVTIALVVACGVAGLVGEFSTLASLRESRDQYYRESRFADLFAGVRRAPLAVRGEIEALPGVGAVKLEVVHDTLLALDHVEQAVTARLVGRAPTEADPGLNALTLRSGRWPRETGALEAVVNERFAQAHRLLPGAPLRLLLNGRLQVVTLVGTVISPEYVYATRAGVPDDLGFAVVWIDADRLAAAYDMQGAFNRVSVSLDPRADAATVREALESVLRPYGVLEAVGRDRQVSHAIVDNELRQLKVFGTAMPALFMAVAIFILNGLMGRQVAMQRPQIATLKALGRDDRTIALHYLGFAWCIALIGAVAGVLGSVWLGEAMLSLYAEVFRFARLDYRTDPWVLLAGVLVVLLTAALGAVSAIRQVLRLSPARAMQPPAPSNYQRSVIERWLVLAGGGPRAAMIARELGLRPWRTASTVLGVALAVAVQISGVFWGDTVEHLIDLQFRQAQPADVTLDFQQHRPLSVVAELQRLPGVLQAEVSRIEPVRVVFGDRSEDTRLLGHPGPPRLVRLIDPVHGAVDPPPEGVSMTRLLADKLGVRRGDTVQVTFRWGRQRQVAVPVVDVAEAAFGQEMNASLVAVGRWAGDGEAVNRAAVRLDASQAAEFHRAVKALPIVAAVGDKAALLRGFEQTTAESLRFFTAVITAFAVVMAVGITYNSARIALSERSWELASLRVLGMTRAEVAALLQVELACVLGLGVPLGCVFGWGLAHGLMRLMQSDQIAFPVVIDPTTYVVAALVVIAAGAASAVIVRRRIDALQLVQALKVRE